MEHAPGGRRVLMSPLLIGDNAVLVLREAGVSVGSVPVLWCGRGDVGFIVHGLCSPFAARVRMLVVVGSFGLFLMPGCGSWHVLVPPNGRFDMRASVLGDEGSFEMGGGACEMPRIFGDLPGQASLFQDRRMPSRCSHAGAVGSLVVSVEPVVAAL